MADDMVQIFYLALAIERYSVNSCFQLHKKPYLPDNQFYLCNKLDVIIFLSYQIPAYIQFVIKIKVSRVCSIAKEGIFCFSLTAYSSGKMKARMEKQAD